MSVSSVYAIKVRQAIDYCKSVKELVTPHTKILKIRTNANRMFYFFITLQTALNNSNNPFFSALYEYENRSTKPQKGP